MIKKKLLIIDDDVSFTRMLKLNLEDIGKYEVYVENDSDLALGTATKIMPDLILLDLMMPRFSGFHVCKALKSKQRLAAIPVIIVSAKSDKTDKVACLDMGADDYMVKPFSIDELDARIRAVLRRSWHEEDNKNISIGKILSIDLPRHEVTVGGKRIDLTAAEFLILVLFATHKTRLFSRSEILDYLWGEEKVVTDRTVDVHIAHLREKLGEAGDFIKNIRGFGYKIDDEN